MRLILLFAVVIGFISTSSRSLAEVAWPGWLGPNRNGWVSYFEPPKKWSKQLKQDWKVNVGDGYGSPVVNDGLIYLHTRQKDDEAIWCLNLETGKTKWRNHYSVPFKIGGGAESHGKGPKSNPTLANSRLFTMGINGVLSAWDTKSGTRLWTVDHRSKFGKRPHPYWGVATSPLVINDRLYVHFGDDEKGFLAALDVETGKEIWRHGKDGAAYASPLFAEFGGVRQIVEWNHEDLLGVETQSGQLLWKYHLPHRGSNQKHADSDDPQRARFGGWRKPRHAKCSFHILKKANGSSPRNGTKNAPPSI